MTVALCVDPAVFHQWTIEDGPIENLSALLVVAAGVVFASMCFQTHAGNAPRKRWHRCLMGVLAFGCILIAGEEVSWFQRQIGFATPATFTGNTQHEFNFHNFRTNLSENAYYSFAFALTVLAPLVSGTLPFARWFPSANSVLPGHFAPSAGVLAAGFNYDMWDVLPIQLTFFVALGALVLAFLRGSNQRASRPVAGMVLLVLIANQAIVLSRGHTQIRIWEVTECKELLIAFALLVFSLELRFRNPTAHGSVSNTR